MPFLVVVRYMVVYAPWDFKLTWILCYGRPFLRVRKVYRFDFGIFLVVLVDGGNLEIFALRKSFWSIAGLTYIRILSHKIEYEGSKFGTTALDKVEKRSVINEMYSSMAKFF